MIPIQQLDAVFFALSDPTRRAVLTRLSEGEASVTELAAPFDLSQPAISKHLKVLERAGLVSVGRDGQRRPRRLEPEPLAGASEWIDRYREIWETNFRRLDALLDELQAGERTVAGSRPPDDRKGSDMPRITPFLWFDAPLEEPIGYYRSIFRDVEVRSLTPMAAEFEIEGQRFMALNGGPKFAFNEAVSFFIECEDQAEVDRYWERLTADGGAESMCGWLKDRYGLSWQIIPRALMRYLNDPDRAKADRVAQEMLRMRKIDIAALDRAAAAD